MKVAFIGHREVWGHGIYEKLVNVIETEIKNGCKNFIMGTHGEFDKMALLACRNLRRKYKDIEIEVVITSFHIIERQDKLYNAPYFDVQTVMFECEDVYFKKRITVSNYKMIDGCQTLICFVDPRVARGGAKLAMNYAKKKGLKIINIF